MAHKLVIVAFMPEFTTDFKSWIISEINHEMENVDESSRQYELDQIVTELREQEDKKGHTLFEEDQSLLALLEHQKVDYVEF